MRTSLGNQYTRRRLFFFFLVFFIVLCVLRYLNLSTNRRQVRAGVRSLTKSPEEIFNGEGAFNGEGKAPVVKGTFVFYLLSYNYIFAGCEWYVRFWHCRTT
jgi:hypothetical protein